MKVVAVIVTYNGSKWIKSCLQSLVESTLSPEIIVVDNASKDDTIEIVSRHFPTVQLISSKINLGFGQANNKGIQAALEQEPNYVFLLNQDAKVAPDTIEKLVQTAELNGAYGLISPFHLNYDGTELEGYFNNFIIGQDSTTYISDLYFSKLEKIYPVRFIHAAAWLMSKECIHKVGGFNPLFFHYFEDNDYVNRANHYGYKAGFVPDAIVYHHGTNAAMSTRSISLETNFALARLANINSKLNGALMVFVKTQLDKISSGVIFFRPKDSWFHLKVLLKVLFKLGAIIGARENSMQEGAYLKASVTN